MLRTLPWRNNITSNRHRPHGWRLRSTTSFVFAIVLSMLTSHAAFADTSGVETWVYQGWSSNDPVCARTLSSIGDWPPGGSITSQSRGYYYFQEIETPCYPDSFGAGELAVSQNLWKWSGSEWGVCNFGGTYYNDVTQQTLQTSWQFGTACGAGYYGNDARSWVLDTWNSAWRGGTFIWSGYLYIA